MHITAGLVLLHVEAYGLFFHRHNGKTTHELSDVGNQALAS